MTVSRLAVTIGPLAVCVSLCGCGSTRTQLGSTFRNVFGSKSRAIAHNRHGNREAYTYVTPSGPDHRAPYRGGASFRTELSEEYLLELGARLTQQGQHAQAAEIYQGILQKNPGCTLARQQLVALNGSAPTAVPRPLPTKPPEASAPEFPAASAPQLVPPAPAASAPDVPTIPDDTQPMPPAKSTAATTSSSARESDTPRFQSSSNRPVTVVGGPQTASGIHHTIRVIPAYRGGLHEIKEFHFGAEAYAKRDGSRPLSPTTRFNRSAIPIHNGKGPLLKSKVPVPPQPTGSKPTGKSSAPNRIELVSDLARRHPELVTLAGFAKRPGNHVDAIGTHLLNRAPAVRSLAAYLLGKAGSSAAPLLPKLEALLTAERNGPTRIRIAEALLRISPDHTAAARVVGDGLIGSERATRWESVCVVGVLVGHQSRETVIATLVDRLDDADEKIRIMAALKLGEFYSDRATILPALKPLAAASKPSKLREAARAAEAVLRQKEN